MYRTGCNAYRQSAGNAVEDNRVVLIRLYDGAIRFIANAKRGISMHSAKIRGENISKAMAIVTELNCALDMDKGGSLSEQLRNLYRFVMMELTVGNLKNDPQALEQAETILLTLKEGFETAINQQKSAARVDVQAAELEMPNRMERLSCAV